MMYSPILAGRVRELKETTEGVEFMCKQMERIFNEGIEIGERRGEKRGRREGKRRGIMETKKKVALSLAGAGMPVERIACMVDAGENLVRKWLSSGEPRTRHTVNGRGKRL